MSLRVYSLRKDFPSHLTQLKSWQVEKEHDKSGSVRADIENIEINLRCFYFFRL